MNYGMPFMGSKSRLAKRILATLPKKGALYDLFGGGGAITHAALLSGKWDKVVYNEVRPLIYDGFVKATTGNGYVNDTHFIDRERFHATKTTDPYAAICFSFANNLDNYAYGPGFEPYAHALHDLCFSSGPQRLFALHKKVLATLNVARKATKKLDRLESLSCWLRLQTVNADLSGVSFERLNMDYQDVPVTGDAVIYCDPPYRICGHSGAGYDIGRKNTFDYARFYDWLRHLDTPVLVSEYDMPDDFVLVRSWDKTCFFDSANGNPRRTVEGLWTPRHQADWWLSKTPVQMRMSDGR